METSTTDGNADSKFAFGKVLVGTSQITVEWIKEINNSAYSFRDTSLAVDEFNEFYNSFKSFTNGDNYHFTCTGALANEAACFTFLSTSFQKLSAINSYLVKPSFL